MINDPELIEQIRQRESEYRFVHTCSMAEIAVSLAECYGIDKELTWKAGMLHDIAKDMSCEEQHAVAEKYGYNLSELSVLYPDNIHAEVGALIAEHEFGLKDKDALNAIRHHSFARPDMSILEKIIFFSDHAEPSRPHYDLMQHMYRIAKTDLDKALMMIARLQLEYEESHNTSDKLREITNLFYDYLLKERSIKKKQVPKETTNAELLTDDEFNKAFDVIMKNGIRIKSVDNIRSLDGFLTADGRRVKKGLLYRSGDLSRITNDDADTLKSMTGISLVIDLRTTQETKRNPDVMIPGVRYENIPLTETLNTDRMDYLVKLYQKAESPAERAWYLAEYARIDEVQQMYADILRNPASLKAFRRIFQLMAQHDGAILFHCTNGKDRTGMLAATLLYMLGCSKEDIICDYNASAISFMAKAETFKAELQEYGYDTELQNGLQTILSVSRENIATGLYYLETNYGYDPAKYLYPFGIEEHELSALREKFLGSSSY